ncbi:hypothetical protein [Streptomyces sp. NPDC059256]|uniref:hypothetical protein n=1 Tax=Streptomyces sp. NPDC059256 TaxID=3346794 RepID=UPI00367CB2C0
MAACCLTGFAAAPLIGVDVVSGAQAATRSVADGAGGLVPYYEDQFSQEGFDFRDRLGTEYRGAYIHESGQYANGYSEFANVAAALVDPRGRTDEELQSLLRTARPEEAPAYDFKLVPLETWKRYLRPGDYRNLRAEGVKNLLMVRAMSFPGLREGRKKTGLHSEKLIRNVLQERRTGRAALKPLSWYTDRGPCEECDEEVIEDGTPTYHAQEYGLSRQERAQRNAELKKAEAEVHKAANSQRQLVERAQKAAKLPAAQRANERKLIKKEMEKVAARRETAEAARQQIIDRYRDIESVRAATARGNLRKDINTARKTDTAARSLFTAAPSNCPRPQAQSLAQSGAATFRLAARSTPRIAGCDGADEQVRGGLVQGLTTPHEAPGGIDFSRLELRYLSDPGADGGGLRYAFKAPLTASDKGSGSTGLAGAKESSDAFFVWLRLEPSTFWVNLNPNEPDRIVDSRLGRTDAGRVLLEADLLLKKTTGTFIHPDTKLGADYWEALSGNCMSFRTWIVPSQATVHQKKGELHILDAPLNVQMETQYLKSRGAKATMSCAEQSTSVQEHNEKVFRRMILPRVVEAVNKAPQYAELRRVYLSRVAAEWYRQLSTRTKTTYGSMIDNGDISAYATAKSWTPRDTFDQYVRSYTNGEFKVTHRTREGNTEYTRTYLYGGVDFTAVPFTSMSGDRLKERWPTLTRDVSRSLAQPVTDTQQGQVWLGGGAQSVDEGTEPGTSDGEEASAGNMASAALRWLSALLPVLLVLFVLRRRARRRSGR